MGFLSRVSAVAQVVTICSGLAACSDTPVLQGIAEIEANRAVAVLDTAGIPARKHAEESGGTGTTFRVVVSSDEVARSVQVLHTSGLPRREEPGFAETFGQPSLVQSASEERARTAQSSAGELARTLERIDGVLDARVHIALPSAEDQPLDGQPGQSPSASVLLRCAGSRSPIDESAVRRLVASSVVGMRPDAVTVVSVATPTAPSSSLQLSYVGPIAVARASASSLRWLLVSAVALNIVLAVALLWFALRRRSAASDETAPAES
ncbi:MAG: hypothetical protein Q8Q09_12350 [Deltaproteobacteria bacterium]|nr:hypothetical protein [Deltaproteobacteria bacterium]